MRPAGEIRQALMKAAAELVTPDRGATLSELAERACVGRDAARVHVSNMRRSAALHIVRVRRVDYRNRPVAEYAPARALSLEDVQGTTALAVCMSDWAR